MFMPASGPWLVPVLPAHADTPIASTIAATPMRIRRGLAVTLPLVAAVIFAAPAALADVGRGYMVMTKDGKVVTGTLMERDASHVTLRLPSGDTQRFDAMEIDRSGPLESGSSSDLPKDLPPMPPPLPKPTTPTIDAMRTPKPEDNAYKGDDAVTVHLPYPESTTAVSLYQRTPSDAWKVICRADCTLKVDPRGTYMVGGFMVLDSASFELPRGAREVTLKATPTVTPIRTAGGILAGVGGAIATVNTALYFALPEKTPVLLAPVAVGASLAIVGLLFLFRTTTVDITTP
jgi:hypothetical protein